VHLITSANMIVPESTDTEPLLKVSDEGEECRKVAVRAQRSESVGVDDRWPRLEDAASARWRRRARRLGRLDGKDDNRR
jgi:hypothetical protein